MWSFLSKTFENVFARESCKENFSNCWFTADVMAAMLVDKNKAFSSAENYTFLSSKFCEKGFLLFSLPTWRPCHVAAAQQYGL